MDKAGLAFIGALGGLVRWVTLREHWLDGFASITVGGVMSGVFAEPFAPILLGATSSALKASEPVLGAVVLDAADFAGPSGFLIGIGGIAISGLIIDLWRALRKRASNGGQNGK